MKISVDRIENNIAICEDENGKMIQIPVSSFETPPFEGVIAMEDNGVFKLLKKETEERKKALKRRLQRLFEN